MRKMMGMLAAVIFVCGCERNSQSASTLLLLDMGAKVNIPTKEILAEMETRNLRPATDSEVREWLAVGNQIPDKVIVIAELDKPETVGVLKKKLAPAFARENETGRVVELSIQFPDDSSPTRTGWFTVSYRFAAMPK